MRPNRHTRRILGTFLVVLLVFASGVVHAQQSPLGQILSGAVQPQPAPRLDRIVQQGVLRVGTTGDFKPFSYLNPPPTTTRATTSTRRRCWLNPSEYRSNS